jgi:C-terminal processing protease CtpA/Prc
MDYILVSYQPGAKLALSLISRTEDSLPAMGNSVVNAVESGGTSFANGVHPNDFLLSINEQYLAFNPLSEIVKIVQNLIGNKIPLSVYYARPNPTKWEKLHRDSTEDIMKGKLMKLNEVSFSF